MRRSTSHAVVGRDVAEWPLNRCRSRTNAVQLRSHVCSAVHVLLLAGDLVQWQNLHQRFTCLTVSECVGGSEMDAGSWIEESMPSRSLPSTMAVGRVQSTSFTSIASARRCVTTTCPSSRASAGHPSAALMLLSADLHEHYRLQTRPGVRDCVSRHLKAGRLCGRQAVCRGGPAAHLQPPFLCHCA